MVRALLLGLTYLFAVMAIHAANEYSRAEAPGWAMLSLLVAAGLFTLAAVVPLP